MCGQISGHTLEEDIKKHLSGDAEMALLAFGQLLALLLLLFFVVVFFVFFFFGGGGGGGGWCVGRLLACSWAGLIMKSSV